MNPDGVADDDFRAANNNNIDNEDPAAVQRPGPRRVGEAPRDFATFEDSITVPDHLVPS